MPEYKLSLQDATGLLSNLAWANTLARALANYCFITAWTSALIRAASLGETVLLSSSIVEFSRADSYKAFCNSVLSISAANGLL